MEKITWKRERGDEWYSSDGYWKLYISYDPDYKMHDVCIAEKVGKYYDCQEETSSYKNKQKALKDISELKKEINNGTIKRSE